MNAFLPSVLKLLCPSASVHAAPFRRGDKNPLLPSRLTTGCLGPSWRLAGFLFYTTVKSGEEEEDLFTSTEAGVRVQPRQVFSFFDTVEH